MLCQHCGKRDATTHIKRVVNGETSESHLCAECASSLGYGDVFGGWGMSLGDLLGGFLSESTPSSGQLAVAPLRCEKCGSTWRDIAREGKVGCANCYRVFYDRLAPSLQRIHGKVRQRADAPACRGKKPAGTARGADRSAAKTNGRSCRRAEFRAGSQIARRDQITESAGIRRGRI